MEYYLKIIQGNDTVTINYGDNQASRGATVAGLHKGNVTVQAWDIDEKGRRWEKDLTSGESVV